jgi:hypothetical protein
MAQKAISPRDLIIRCYAEQEPDGSWFAMCIDLNLCAEAGSLNEAKRKLRAIIGDYVLEVMTRFNDSPELLRRPAPLSFVLRYHVISMRCRFERWRESKVHKQIERTHERYQQTLPMVPANAAPR